MMSRRQGCEGQRDKNNDGDERWTTTAIAPPTAVVSDCLPGGNREKWTGTIMKKGPKRHCWWHLLSLGTLYFSFLISLLLTHFLGTTNDDDWCPTANNGWPSTGPHLQLCEQRLAGWIVGARRGWCGGRMKGMTLPWTTVCGVDPYPISEDEDDNMVLSSSSAPVPEGDCNCGSSHMQELLVNDTMGLSTPVWWGWRQGW